MNKIDDLLKKQYYVIDILPEKIQESSDGQFFDVEYYLLNSPKHYAIKDRFVNVVLKLMCYYHTSMFWNKWIDRPEPVLIDNAVNTIMDNHSGTLNILFIEEQSLLVFDWDCLNLTLYNPSEALIIISEKIAYSEGLFMRNG